MRTCRFITLGLALTASATALAADPAQKEPVPTKADRSVKTKADELPKSGVNIARKKGGWVNVEGSGARVVVKFFDAEKKPVPPDVERGLARFNYTAKNDVRAPLHREGDTLVTPGIVRAPHVFRVILTLLASGATDAEETLTFKYP